MRPLLLDLFCGDGGAAAGYHSAGFDVIGVDLMHKHAFPYEFERGDALAMLERLIQAGMWLGDREVRAVHASPPCKLFTIARNADRGRLKLFEPHEDLLTPTLELLEMMDVCTDGEVPWIVENVVGAPMPANSVQLCGSSFGLAVRRHRLFASNVPLEGKPCDHAWQDAQGPIYPSLNQKQRARTDGRGACVVAVYGGMQSKHDSIELRRWAMGIDWMDNPSITQAIPPAFTEHLGRQLLEHLR